MSNKAYAQYTISDIRDGEDGVGILSIEEQYYKSTSNSTQTGGSWIATQPTWENGYFIWTRSKITWDNPVSDPNHITYTTPVLSTTYQTLYTNITNKINNIATEDEHGNWSLVNGVVENTYVYLDEEETQPISLSEVGANITTTKDSILSTVSSTYATQTALTSEANKRKATYVTCSTGASTQAKIGNCSNFELYNGATITCVFSNANTKANPTLNVNGTGAKTIKSYSGATLTEDEYKWEAGSSFTLVYDQTGNCWRMQDSGVVSRLSVAETAIEQTANNVLIKATQSGASSSDISQGAQTVIQSLINVAPSGVTIDADKVNINGAAIFTSGRLSETSLNNAYRDAYAISETGGSTANKTTQSGTPAGFTLYNGATVTVKFNNANTNTTPTLNVNGTGSKIIKSYTGGALTEAEYKWAAGAAITFVYDGTYWRMQDGGALQAKADASASASAASSSASSASSSASSASSSASSASSSASTATNKANEAASSASTASTKAGEASASATTASTKAGEASTSATNAANSATTASNKASEASASATNASNSATDAANSATAAAEVMGGFSILWNYSAFGTAGAGKAYICAFDPSTGTKSDANGWVKWNGTKRTITKQLVNPNNILPYRIPIYIVCRLSSATGTSGTNYMVWYNSGWKYASLPTPTAVGGSWTWTDNRDIILGKFVATSNGGVLTECEIYNPPWTSKQITTDTNTSVNAQATANSAAYEEQYIYISKASGTTSVSGNTTWVTSFDDVQDTWTTKRPTYSSNYPVLFIAKQRKTVYGTVSCTTPVKDDTTTVIDGGHITTGTIDASVVTVTNLNANNITGGTLNINYLPDDAKNSNISIGGRNLILDTGSMTSWETNNGTTISNGIITFPTVTTATWREVWTTKGLPYSLIRNKTIVVSAKVKASQGSSCILNFCLGVSSGATTYTRAQYSNNGNSFTGTGDWQTISSVIDITDAYFTSGSGSDFNVGNIAFRPGVWHTSLSGFQMKECKLEIGNIATDWTPAPEDMQTDIDNARKVATNYLVADNTGLMVYDGRAGAQTSSTVTTGNTLITSTGMQIRSGTTVLADYGTGITLYKPGTNNAVVTIDSNGGSFTGSITASSGYIGGTSGWAISTQQLSSGTIGSDGSMFLSTANLAGTVAGQTLTTTSPSWRFTVGSKFGVTNQGQMYCSGGKIGSWIIDPGVLRGYGNSSGSVDNPEDALYYAYLQSSAGSNGGNYAFAVRTRDSTTPTQEVQDVRYAPVQFGVLYDGRMFAKQANIEGTITATSGKIGLWDITSSGLRATDSSTGKVVVAKPGGWAFAAGGTSHSSYDDCPFRVSAAGALYATSANITGVITANTGYIGGTSGWTIEAQHLYSGTIGTDSSMHLGTKNLGSSTTIAGRSGSDWRLTVGSRFGVASNGYLYSSGGNIAGWIINPGVLRGYGNASGAVDTAASALYYTYVQSTPGTNGGNYAFAVRARTSTTATDTVPDVHSAPVQFGVTHAGSLYSIKGTIGGWSINSSALSRTSSSNTVTLNASGIAISNSSDNSETSLKKNNILISGGDSGAAYVKILNSDSNGDDGLNYSPQCIVGATKKNIALYFNCSNGNRGLFCNDTRAAKTGRTCIPPYSAFVLNTDDHLGIRCVRRMDFYISYWQTGDTSLSRNWGQLTFYESDDGNTLFRPNNSGGVYLGSSANRWSTIFTDKAVNTGSDLKTKNIIKEYDWKVDEFIQGLKPIAYNLKNSESGRIHMGFGAQDVAKLVKDLDIGDLSLYEADIVLDDRETRKYHGEEIDDSKLSWGLKYSEFIAPMVLEMQRLMNRVSALENELALIKKSSSYK